MIRTYKLGVRFFVERGALLGVIGGAAVFIIILTVIMYSHSSFDQKLIDQVEDGVPAEELILQIDAETNKLKKIAKARLESVVMDRRFWGDGELATPAEYESYIVGYEFEMKIINQYDLARKKYANREITKREFLSEIKGPKDFYNLYSNIR